jgi:hypothetical protein
MKLWKGPEGKEHSLILVWHKATTVKIHHFFLVEKAYPVLS